MGSLIPFPKNRSRGTNKVTFTVLRLADAGVVPPTPATPAKVELYDAVHAETPDLLPPREWLLGTTFCRGFVSGLVGAGGVGKSAIRLVQLLSAATGRALTGEPVRCKCKVLLISLEDSLTEIYRRIAAARIHYNITPTDLEHNFFVACPRSLKLLEQGTDGSRVIGGLAKYFDQPFDIISLDPFVKAHAMPENDNGAMDDVLSFIVQKAEAWNYAADFVHHSRKGPASPGDVDSARGASALIDAGRLIRTVSPMSQEDGALLGIHEADRPRYVRLDDAKINLAAHAGAAMWFRLVGVALGNTTVDPLYPKGDTIQTVERWYPPNPWDSIRGAVANRILDDIEAAVPRCSDHPQAYNRAAWPLVQHHAPELSEQQCRNVISIWLKSALLAYGECQDNYRKPIRGLFVNNARRPS
jgi:hypothetical protein